MSLEAARQLCDRIRRPSQGTRKVSGRPGAGSAQITRSTRLLVADGPRQGTLKSRVDPAGDHATRIDPPLRGLVVAKTTSGNRPPPHQRDVDFLRNRPRAGTHPIDVTFASILPGGSARPSISFGSRLLSFSANILR